MYMSRNPIHHYLFYLGIFLYVGFLAVHDAWSLHPDVSQPKDENLWDMDIMGSVSGPEMLEQDGKPPEQSPSQDQYPFSPPNADEEQSGVLLPNPFSVIFDKIIGGLSSSKERSKTAGKSTGRSQEEQEATRFLNRGENLNELRKIAEEHTDGGTSIKEDKSYQYSQVEQTEKGKMEQPQVSCARLWLAYTAPQGNLVSRKKRIVDPSSFFLGSRLKGEDASSWSNCGKSSDLFDLKVLKVSPDPPIRGRNISVQIKGTLKKPIDGKERISLVVRYGPVKIYDRTTNLCSEATKLPDVPHCPFQPGDVDIQRDILLPDDIPPGLYIIQATAWSEQFDSQIFCITGKIKFEPNVI